MSHLSISNVRFSGISASVPSDIEDVKDFALFSEDDAYNFSKTTGVERRRIADVNTTSADLCLKAAEKLIEGLNWENRI